MFYIMLISMFMHEWVLIAGEGDFQIFIEIFIYTFIWSQVQ